MNRLLALVLAIAAAAAACANDPAAAGEEATAQDEVKSCTSCSADLSPFAKKSVSLLAARFCDEAKGGDKHENAAASTAAQKEKDTIFTLLAFAAVSKQWDLRRGQQIGAVIVGPGDRVLKVGFNANFAEGSSVEHAEVRAIRGFFSDTHRSDGLEDATVYGTLEPCPMCAGTITMARMKRVVFGMKDNRFGDALAYLHAFPYHADFEMNLETRTSKALAEAVARDPEASLGPMMDRMKYAFDWAVEDLERFDVQHRENENALKNARAALAGL